MSNTSYAVRASKDDIHLSGKTSKAGISAQDKKPIVLSQPAQRPASVTGIKAILNSVNPRPIDNASRQGLTDTTSHNTANNRKLLTKRSNVVFKDHLPPVAEAKLSTVKQTAPRTSDPVKEDPITRPSTASSYREHPKKETKQVSLPAKINDVQVIPSALDIHSESSYVIEPPVPAKVSPVEPSLPEEKEPPKADVPEAVSLPEAKEAHKPEGTLPRDSLDLAHARSDHAVAPSEPEEYWDEEDDYNEEDDGYATARSYPSRSENTTGAAAPVLFPKYNQKAKKEIAVAKQIVESSRTTDDIEDEMWDTSMVAEYGDEIFDYMRELEVRLSTQLSAG